MPLPGCGWKKWILYNSGNSTEAMASVLFFGDEIFFRFLVYSPENWKYSSSEVLIMSKYQNRGNGRWGYYIALGLCAVAIGVSVYLYEGGSDPVDPVGNQPDQTVGATLPGEDVPALATKPTNTPSATEDTQPTTVPPATQKDALKTAYPLEGQTVAVYAMDALTYNQTTRDWRTHDGLDIGAEAGTTVCAAAEGMVYTVFEDDTMGTTVVIRHQDGYVTEYSSLGQEVLVKPGEQVSMGQAIGTVGTSALLETALGSHVHFSVSRDGESVDPVEFLNMG